MPNHRERMAIFLFLSLLLHFFLILSSPTPVHSPAPDVLDTPLDLTLTEEPHPKPTQVVDVVDPLEDYERPKDADYLSLRNRIIKQETKAKTMLPLFQFKVRQDEPVGDGERLAKLLQIPDTNYLPTVKYGQYTFLNTVEFRHTSFYLAFKRQVGYGFDPRAALIRFIRQGNGLDLVGKEIKTDVLVVMNDDGTIHDVILHHSSGIKPLDDEVLRVIWWTSPFYKQPPKELLSQDGRLRFMFSFVLG